MLAIKHNRLLLLNVKWYAQRDLEYMGLMERMYPKHKKMQKYFLTEKWKSLQNFEDMIALWRMTEQKKQANRKAKKEHTMRSSQAESEIKQLNRELNTTLLEQPAPAIEPANPKQSLFQRLKSLFQFK